MNFIGTPEKNNYKVEKHERVSNGFKTPEEVLQEVDEIEASKTQNGNNANFSKYMDYVYGAKSGTEKSKAKQKIAAAYLLGAIDRGDVNRVKSVLASGTLDKYLTAENKHKFMSMADTKIKAQEKQARMDNMYQIFDIKQNAVIQAASGQYSIPQAIVDNQKIVELGGKPTTMLTTAGIKGEKTLSEKEYKARKAKAIDTLNTAFEGVIKNGKVDPEAKLRSILKFQNTLIANRQYLSPSEYKQYNKMADPIIKSIKGMRKNIFGMPQGEISGNDPTHRGYLAIYNFAHRAYAGKENQQNAIKNMLLDFSRYEEAFRNKTGKEPTQAQAANLANRAIQNQRMKSNKYLRNIPKSGITMRDKYGNLVKMYPNGKHEIIKYGR